MAKIKTINQALDAILSKYKSKDMDKFPAVEALKHTLVETKVHYGGNSFLEDADTVEKIIQHGTSDPSDWK